MAESDGQERTEAATAKRLADAKKEGQVVRSRELGVLLSLLGSGLSLFWIGPMLVDTLKQELTRSLVFDSAAVHNPAAMTEQLTSTAVTVSLVLLPFLGVICLLSLAGPLALGGWTFNTGAMMPKLDRINPLSGIARMFSVRSLIELVKAIAKVALVGSVAWLIFTDVLGEVVRLPLGDISGALQRAGNLILWCLVGFSAALLVVAGLDVPYQIWQHRQQLMMTKQEVKDESKETEGRPEVKSALRRRQQEVAQRRMMQQVPKADVVITNPTHYAVALKYDASLGSAPVVLAKGKDEVAARIREVAQEHRIALFSAPPLARALYASTELNRQIPEDLFVAVAQVLAWIYQVKRAATQRKTAPPPPMNLPVPASYDKSKRL